MPLRRASLLEALVAVAILCGSASPVFAQIKAFPQAEGFGAVALGGRGGDVYHVTNLNDTGSGSLRFGIDNAPGSGRTIVFDVGGWITINSKLGIDNTKSKITLAGQTAPGGIGVRGDQFSIGGKNIIVRHMRFKPGKDAGRVDSAGANSDAQYVIYDHVSAGYSHDENFSVAGSDLTLQYSTVSFGLEDHSAGSLIEQAHRLSFHHDLYAHNNTRNPKARVNETIDWVDNVVYDYNNGFIAGDSDTSDYFWTANVDGNYYITGPGDTGRPMIVDGRAQNYGLYFGTNAYDNDGDAVHDGTVYTGNGVDGTGLTGVVSGTYTWAATPYPTPTIWKDASPQAAYLRTLSQFGATPWARDEVDTLLYNDVVNRTGTIISHENELVPLGITNGGFGTLGGGSTSLDTDHDGMPDAWEVKHGTNPNVATNNADFDQDGYTDLEEYLNELAAFPAPGPLQFSGIGRYADWKRWTNRWEPSRFDDVRVNSGAAFVDAVGQNAGILRVGDTADARLYVTSGWIEVANNLVVGGTGVGSVRQYGGEMRVLSGKVDIQNGNYQLIGGVLTTPQLTKTAAGSFSMTGGTLHAGEVDFDLLNAGGIIAPGQSIGQTSILGNLTLNSGALQIELAAAGIADSLLISGNAMLGGSLDVALLNGFVPINGQSWQILTAGNFFGSFASITAGYSLQQLGNSLWLVRSGSGSGGVIVPEPSTSRLLLVAAMTVSGALCLRRAFFKGRLAGSTLALVASLYFAPLADAVNVKVIADAELRENGTTGAGDATDAGAGTATSLNARWSNTNRNEWIALKFDLSAFDDKSRLASVALRTYMFRTDANNTKNLRIYALTPGTANEDWNESTITYGSMPGFTFDSNSTTNILDVGGKIQSLGTFSVSGVGNEGNLAQINPASLTTLVQGMGNNNLLTLLVSYQDASNGQWRIAAREATQTATGALTGTAGDFSPFLQFNISPIILSGDYSGNGIVDAADYTVWRDTLGATSLTNEEVSPGKVDIADELYWAERFNATMQSGSGGLVGANSAVPEPASITMAVIALVLLAGVARRLATSPHLFHSTA